MDYGSIKNVGTAAVDEIVKERKENGDFKDFSDFCERIKNSQVNKKCVESLIKAGAFDTFGQTRKTLMASFEEIIDTIADSASNKLQDIRKRKRRIEQDIRSKLNTILHSSTYSKFIRENIVTIRNGRFVIPVKEEYRKELVLCD